MYSESLWLQRRTLHAALGDVKGSISVHSVRKLHDRVAELEVIASSPRNSPGRCDEFELGDFEVTTASVY